MDCCKTSKQDFLLGKAKNFRDFINRFQPAEEIVTYMSSFREDTLIATLLGVVVPIVQSGTTASAVTDLMKKLNVPDAEKTAVADKIRRYLEMFATVVLQ